MTVSASVSATTEAPTQDATAVVAETSAPVQDSTEVTTPTTPTQDSTTVSEQTTPTQDSTDVSTPDTNNNGAPTQDSTDVSTPDTTTTTPPTTTTTTTQTPVGPTGGSGDGSGFSSGGGSITSGTPISSTATSTVVDGINMSCGDLFKTYMKKGKVNNKAEVIRLQAFLNKNLKLKLKVDGVFGSQTEAAVKKFQLKYKDSTLTPWGLKLPTGYVFKTTQRQLNLLVCPANDIPMPILK